MKIWMFNLRRKVIDHKLYDEIDTHRQGRKAAKINVAAAVGLMYTPISNKNFGEILMVSNIIPPCTSSMQKTSQL
jgi:hypothetical protein